MTKQSTPATDADLALLVNTAARLIRDGEDFDTAARRALDLIAACRRQLALAGVPDQLGGAALLKFVTGQRRTDRAKAVLLRYLRAGVTGVSGEAKDAAADARFEKLFGSDDAPMPVQDATAHRQKFNDWRERRTARQHARAATRLSTATG